MKPPQQRAVGGLSEAPAGHQRCRSCGRLIFVARRRETVTSCPGPGVGEPVNQDFALRLNNLGDLNRRVENQREVEQLVADNLLVLEELDRFIDPEGRDGEAVLHNPFFSFDAFNSREQ